MGKSQYKKKLLSKQRRHNPLRVPDGHAGPSSSQADSAQEVLPIIRKLSSPDATERTWALSSLHHLCAHAPTRRLFLKGNIVSHLIQRLTDPVEEVVLEATGALRNLSVEELEDGETRAGESVGDQMGKGDVMTPLGSIIAQITKTLASLLAPPTQPPTPLTPQQSLTRRLLFPLSENVIAIIQNLSETSNKTLNILNTHSLPDGLTIAGFLLSFLQPAALAVIPESTVLAVAQCLFSLSSDNPPFLAALLALSPSPSAPDAPLQILLQALEYRPVPGQPRKEKAKKGEGVEAEAGMEVDDASGEEGLQLIRIVLAGTLRNLSPPEAPLIPGLDEKWVVPLVMPLLDVDLEAVVGSVEELVKGLPDDLDASLQASRSLLSGSGSELLSPSHKSLDLVELRLSTLLVALEIIGSVCASGDVEDGEPVEEWEDGDDGMEMDGEGDDEDEEALIARGRDQEPGMEVDLPGARGGGVVNAGLLEGLIAIGLHSRLMTLAQPTRLSFPPLSSDPTGPVHPGTTSLLSSIHLRALEALNNLLQTLSTSAPTPSPPLGTPLSNQVAAWNAFVQDKILGLQGVWEGSFAAAVAIVGAGGEGLGEARIACLDVLEGVWWGLVRVGGLGVLVITEQQIQMVIQSFEVVGEEGKGRVVNALSALAMRPGVTVAENRAIGTFLCSLLASPSPPTVVSALNSIFDIYGDERSTYDRAVFMEAGFLGGLVKTVGKVKAMVKSIDRRRDAELRNAAQEVYENLTAFIKYRRSVA